MLTRKEKIALYLKNYTEKALNENGLHIHGITASAIAEALEIDRTTSSRELNSLYSEGIAMKFLGRPTHYLHYDTITSTFAISIPATIPIGYSLVDYTDTEKKTSKSHFDHTPHASLCFSPYETTFQKQAQLAEAALRYPSPELHILLILPDSISGIDLASHMLTYGQYIGRFSSSAKLYTYECHVALKAAAAYNTSIQLFGTTGTTATSAKKGLVEKAADSILFFNNIQFLSSAVEERLQTLLLKNTFSRCEEDSFVRRNHALIVAACSESAYNNNENTLFSYFPMKILFPPMKNWTTEELFRHVCLLFQEQAKNLHCKIRLGKDVLFYLLCAIHTGDSISIQTQVKSLCAIAYSKKACPEFDYLEIYPEYLPAFNFMYPNNSRTTEFSIFLNKYFEKYITISEDSIPLILPAPSPVAPSHTLNQTIPKTTTGHNMKNALETYLFSSWQTNIEFTPAISPYTQLLYHIIKKQEQFPQIQETDPLLTWASQSLESFLQDKGENFRKMFNTKNLIPENIPSFIYEMAKQVKLQIVQYIPDKLQNIFILYIATLIDTIYQWILDTKIVIFTLYRDSSVNKSISAFLESECQYTVTPLTLPAENDISQLSKYLEPYLQTNTSSQFLIFADTTPFAELDEYITRTFAVPAKCFSNTTLSFMIKTIKKITNCRFNLSMLLRDSSESITLTDANIPEISVFVLQAIQRLLTPTLNFIDIYKSLPILRDSLKQITASLELTLSDELAIKYYFHCAHMIERLIRKSTLRYPGMKLFINLHAQEYRIVEFALQPLSQFYGFKIVASEIAYVVEIFL